MGTTRRHGFTIIEVMLFLAITGLIVAGILTGVAVSLNRQRYTDANGSLLSYLQSQYNLAMNVNNSHDTSLACQGGAIVSTGGSNYPGTSECTIVGRIITTDSASNDVIESSAVYSTVDARTLGSDPTANDMQILKDANLIKDPASQPYQMQWGTKLLQKSTHVPANFTILIVRMPTSGLVHTIATSQSNIQPADILNAPSSGAFYMCVSPEGLLGNSNDPTGVKLAPDAASSAGVTFVSQGDC